MSNVWFTADTHFHHEMVAKLRGFTSAQEHDDVIIYNWNSVVQKNDQVWLLGDVGMRSGFLDDCVTRLNGEIHLITGNHDAPWPGNRESHKAQRRWSLYFASIQAYATRKIYGRRVLLSHFPYGGDHTEEERHSQYRLRDEGLPLIHGHLHSSDVHTGPRQLHVGLDAWLGFPVRLDVVSLTLDKILQHEESRHLDGAQ